MCEGLGAMAGGTRQTTLCVRRVRREREAVDRAVRTGRVSALILYDEGHPVMQRTVIIELTLMLVCAPTPHGKHTVTEQIKTANHGSCDLTGMDTKSPRDHLVSYPESKTEFFAS